MTKAKILSFGSLNLDYVYSVDNFVLPGETISCNNYSINLGGKGLNQSTALSKSGAIVYHAGKIGANGKVLKDFLNSNNINTDFLVETTGPDGHAIIMVNKDGENSIIIYHGSNFEITKDEIDKCINSFDEGDYLVLQNEINNLDYIIDKAYEKNLKIVLNPSPITDSITKLPLEKVYLLIVNEVEGQVISGKIDSESILIELTKKYPKVNIVLTLGKNGSIFSNGKETVRVKAKEVKAIDTTGAGDTYTGFLIGMLSQGKDIKEAMEFATTASGISVTRNGAAASIPSLDEVLKTLNNGGKI